MSVFSLPTQRCFRVVERLEDVIGTFLCLRRGVSGTGTPPSGAGLFSLPTQRCFYAKERKELMQWLFSAYAEVFLPSVGFLSLRRSFLCLRRGVSAIVMPFDVKGIFSLPTQRCFRLFPERTMERNLFSAYAEVFLNALRFLR